MLKKLKIGLIGAGCIGKVHTESIMTRVENGKLLMVADVFAESANQLGQKYAIAATADYRDILNHADID